MRWESAPIKRGKGQREKQPGHSAAIGDFIRDDEVLEIDEGGHHHEAQQDPKRQGEFQVRVAATLSQAARKRIAVSSSTAK